MGGAAGAVLGPSGGGGPRRRKFRGSGGGCRGRFGVGGDGIEFWGQSFVAGTSGQILAKASADKEETLIVPVDLSNVDTTRTHWPFLRDRRIDAYGDLLKRYRD